MKLKNRTAIITGASQGLGLEIAKAFVREGADTLICARTPVDLASAHKTLSTLSNGRSQIFSEVIDVSNPQEIKKLVDSAHQHFDKIDILVSNAGVYGPKGPLETVDWEAWCHTLNINLFGTVNLCKLLLPHFKKNNYGKIILLSGAGVPKPHPNFSAYSVSKAAIVQFGRTLAAETSAYSIDVNCIAPGALNTRFLEEVLAAGPEKIGAAFYEQSVKQKETGGVALHRAADLCIYLASAISDGISGKLLSAVWDPWETLHTQLEKLHASDLYTLRRIDQ